MELAEAIAFVRRYNAWRRCDDDSEMPHPKDIGRALDALCDHAERLARELERELAAERALADKLAHWLMAIEIDELVPDAWLPPVTKALAAWKDQRK